MMRVLFFFALFVVVFSLIATVSSQCADGSSPFNCLVRPCNANSCKKGIDFCVDDYCGGCNAKCRCDSNADCDDGQQCQSGFCAAVSTTAPPSPCPSSVETSECVCSHLGKYWAVGGFFDGCNSCECTADKRVLCTRQICPIIPTDQPTEEPITSESSSTTAPEESTTATTPAPETTSVAEESTIAPMTCPDGSPQTNCLSDPCLSPGCKRGGDFCTADYCGGCKAKCVCESHSDCYDGQECFSGFCSDPIPCPSDVQTRRCICHHLGKWYEDGNFWDGCRGCTCLNDGAVVCGSSAICTDPPTQQPTAKPISTTPATPTNTCLITNHDFSSCENGLTPCAFTTCAAGSQCLTHRCGTENNQCQAICSCGDDSHCASGQICASNEFGIKVCKADTNQECPDGRPGVRCFAAPCSVLSSDRQCKKGADFCLNDYCGGCNANCQCDSNSDCYSDQECKADWKGKKICQSKSSPATTTTRAPTTPTPTTSPSSKVCISNLDCRRGERCDFPFWFSLFGRCVPRTTRPPTTTTPRPAQCEYNGRIFQSGESFPSADGCNNCFCNENGVIGCTKKACICPAGQGFASCKVAPCDIKSCKSGLCTNDYCGGCFAKCRCERDNDCQQGEVCQLDQSGWNHCVNKPTTTTTTRKPSRTTTTTAAATTACAGKVCPAILCANRAPCKYQCGINYCSCTDYCKCKTNNHCDSNERCEIASGETEGKCVNKNRPLLSKLDKF